MTMGAPSVVWVFKAKVIRVVDGDTVDAEVDLGFRCFCRQRLRLVGPDGTYFNAPESRGALATESGRDAGRFLGILLPPGTGITTQTYKNPQDKYGRWPATVWVTDGPDDDCATLVGRHIATKP